MAVSKIRKSSVFQILTRELGTATIGAGLTVDFGTDVSSSLSSGWKIGGIAELVKTGGSNGNIVPTAWWVDNGVLKVRMLNTTSSSLTPTVIINVLFIQ